ncbi:MAG: type I restriction endonuclease subunit R [Anaerolineales bacterium]|jgi:type I restriction enzyme R subunit
MTHHGTETEFEYTTIQRLEALGYQHVFGMDIERSRDEVVLKDVLRQALHDRYSDLPGTALDDAVHMISRPDGVDTLRRNLAFHQLLTRGFDLKVEFSGGKTEFRHIYPVNWDEPAENDFRVINQFPIHGQNDRRPDVIIFVNGLPLVLFELKNPYSEKPSVEDAFNQIQHYTYEIPQVFDFNAFTVISDGITSLHGVWTAGMEWFSPWKSIDGYEVEPNTTGSMKTLIEGLFPKERLLQYIRDFLVFEVVNEKITKKGARYHQFFAVRIAAQKTLETYQRLRSGASPDRRIGVIWHTTGSGKSLSMAFLVGILRRAPELENPIFVIEVDRNDLDDQLHDQFLAAHLLVGNVRQAVSVSDLRSLLDTSGGEVIFTTIEKFTLQEKELDHPILNTRPNVILIADEAHRSQYGFKEGYARYLSDALPNAMRLGFTGTPISLGGADTTQVFGDLIHTYDILQSQIDKATVPIYYEARQIPLALIGQNLDTRLGHVTAGQDPAEVNRNIPRWGALAAAARSDKRLKNMAQDLLAHYLDRTATLKGKAMIVCMERLNCVRLYEALQGLPGCPPIKIVMTGNLSEDPPEWSQKGYLTTKSQRDAIKQHMIDPEDPLSLVIVCDMWLTGTDIPCLHTLYVDKPMEGHNMIQAISRVNRVFSDKPHGLIVDYIGIGDALREATAHYTQGGGQGDVAAGIDQKARPLFLEALKDIHATLPRGKDYGGWRHMSEIEVEDLYALVYGYLATEDDRRDSFLQVEARLSSAFLLVKHLDECRIHADEIIFYQRVRKQIMKIVSGRISSRELDRAVQDLVDDSVQPQGVVDIFKAAGITRPDISILDDAFLQTFKDHPPESLQVKLLERLLADEIEYRRRSNLTRSKSFKETLEKTLQEYHNRLIDAKEVIEQMIAIKQQMDAETQRAQELGLNGEELAFYDAVASNFINLYNETFLRELVHDVVQTLKRNLKVDWTEPHRQDVQAAVRAAVRRVLKQRKVHEKDLEPFLGSILVQAEALYADWPVGEMADLGSDTIESR